MLTDEELLAFIEKYELTVRPGSGVGLWSIIYKDGNIGSRLMGYDPTHSGLRGALMSAYRSMHES